MHLSKNVRHSFTTREYRLMVDAGVLPAGVRVELIRGEVMDMPPQASEHASVVAVMQEQLTPLVQPHGHIRCSMPIVLDERSQPQPDLAIVLAHPDRYRSAHPAAADVLFLVEVADKTLHYDRTVKASLYAAARIPTLWILDLPRAELHCFDDPGAEGYRQRAVLRRKECVKLPAPFKATLDLGALL